MKYLILVIFFVISIGLIEGQYQTVNYYYGIENNDIQVLAPTISTFTINGYEIPSTFLKYTGTQSLYSISLTKELASSTDSYLNLKIKFSDRGEYKSAYTLLYPILGYINSNIYSPNPKYLNITGYGLASNGEMIAAINGKDITLKCDEKTYSNWKCNFPTETGSVNSCFSVKYTAPHLGGEDDFENTIYIEPFLNSIKMLGNSLLLDINFKCPGVVPRSIGVSLEGREFKNSVYKADGLNQNLYYFEQSSIILCQNPLSTFKVQLLTGEPFITGFTLYSNPITLHCNNDNSDVPDAPDVPDVPDVTDNCSKINLNYYYLVLFLIITTLINHMF